jgi:endonuclease YncB( thermonuclease family)
MDSRFQSLLWFCAGAVASAAILLIARGNPATALAPPAARAEAAAGFQGQVAANVVSVVDGDTFRADAQIWLGQSVDVKVRIAGMDAPELHARCDDELKRAEAARDYLRKRIEGGTIWLSDVRYDKYGGRIRAVVVDDQGDIAKDMIAKGLARPYHGERRRSWCATT